MAQRRRAAGTFACGLFLRMSLLLPLRSPFVGQPKEDQAVPASAGDGNRNRAERGIVPVLKPEPLRQNLDQNSSSFPLPAEQRARQGQAAIRWPSLPFSGCGADWFAAQGEEVSRRHHAQVGIACDLAGPLASAFG